MLWPHKSQLISYMAAWSRSWPRGEHLRAIVPVVRQALAEAEQRTDRWMPSPSLKAPASPELCWSASVTPKL